MFGCCVLAFLGQCLGRADRYTYVVGLVFLRMLCSEGSYAFVQMSFFSLKSFSVRKESTDNTLPFTNLRKL